MTNARKKAAVAKGQYTVTMPERYGGSLFFRVRYLESKWVRFIFQTLVTSVAVMLVMTAVAGKVDQWQTEYRQQSLNRIETQLILCSQQQATAELAGDLTGQAASLERQITLLQQKQLLLTPSVPSEVLPQEIVSVTAEITNGEKALEELKNIIADTYDAAKMSYRQGNTLKALGLFQTVGGYEDADGWQRLCSVRIHQETGRYIAQGKSLTAWVQQTGLLQKLKPHKAAGMPVSFGPLQGIWICRNDQQVHMQTLTTETGDGRAGIDSELKVMIRCLMAKGDILYGYFAEGMPTVVSEEDFSEMICCGGVLQAEKTEDNQDPASAVLSVRAQKSGEEAGETISKIRVISENIIAIEEGMWKGTYYRVLDPSD